MFLSFQYAWGVLDGQLKENLFVSKPYVYRQLVPILASFSPLDFVTSTAMISFAFCIGVVAIMFYIYKENYKENISNDIMFILAFSAVIAFSSKCAAYYDMASAFFFTLLLVLWSKEKYRLSIPVFALACINRETSVLLIPFFFIIYRKINLSLIMVAIFFTIRQAIVWAFSSADGQAMYIAPIENIKGHADHIFPTIILILIAISVLTAVFRKKKNVPFIFILFPCFFVVYIVLGYPFETRVFIEVTPVMFLSAFLTPD